MGAFLNIIKDNVNLVSLVPTDLVESVVEDYTSHGKPIYLKVLRKLCKCKRQAVTSNQVKHVKAQFLLNCQLISVKTFDLELPIINIPSFPRILS